MRGRDFLSVTLESAFRSDEVAAVAAGFSDGPMPGALASSTDRRPRAFRERRGTSRIASAPTRRSPASSSLSCRVGTIAKTSVDVRNGSRNALRGSRINCKITAQKSPRISAAVFPRIFYCWFLRARPLGRLNPGATSSRAGRKRSRTTGAPRRFSNSACNAFSSNGGVPGGCSSTISSSFLRSVASDAWRPLAATVLAQVGHLTAQAPAVHPSAT